MVVQKFRARVAIYSLGGARLTEGECLLEVDARPFARSAWSGWLTGSPALRTLAAGRYQMRLPNGRVREVNLGEYETAGRLFTGIGTLPMP